MIYLLSQGYRRGASDIVAVERDDNGYSLVVYCELLPVTALEGDSHRYTRAGRVRPQSTFVYAGVGREYACCHTTRISKELYAAFAKEGRANNKRGQVNRKRYKQYLQKNANG